MNRIETTPLVVDLDVLQRYDKPGPRYTSYPTAPHFSSACDSTFFLEEVERTNQAESPPDLSLYFHLPFCDTLCYFCGCTMIITRNRSRMDQYVDYLIREIELVSSKMKQGRKVVQLHWGGGTPTYLSPDQIRRLFAAIENHFDFHDDAEIGVEIDPRELTEDHLDALQDVGFNRASMGVQDFDEKVQQAINRLQSEELTRWAFDGLRERGFQSINLDLIYGLPFQTVTSFEATLDRIIAFSPDRLAVFNYAHVPWMKKHQQVIKEDSLPSPLEKLSILKLTIEKLTSTDFVFIGMDHFAKPDDSLTKAFYEKKLYRNFQGYSTFWGSDLHAMGMSSISQFGRIYAQNMKAIDRYYAELDQGKIPTERGYRLDKDDEIRRYVITKLMCDFELDKRHVERKFDIIFDDYFQNAIAALAPMIADGIVEQPDGVIRATPTGHLLIRNVAMAFDKYLEAKSDSDGPMYSRTV